MKKQLKSHSVRLTKTDWKAALIGGFGGFAGYIIASLGLSPFVSDSGLQATTIGSVLLSTSLLSMVSGAVLSCAILAFDNTQSLRGKWNRDMMRGLPLFAVFGLLSGGLGQLIYSLIGLTRAGAWILMGAGIGAGIGLLRHDKVQAKQGAWGGAIGGLIGGVLVDVFLLFSYTETAFALATLFGIVIVGALIALMMRLVQNAFKNAWLVGVSTGPYEGKEYPLNTERVSVGRSEMNDISLYRASELPMQSGALIFQDGKWMWQGEALEVNSQLQTKVELHSEDSLRFGATTFRFKIRSADQLGHPAQQPFVTQFDTQTPAVNASVTSSTLQDTKHGDVVSWNLVDANKNFFSLTLCKQISIGRAPHCGIVLDDSAVSAEHASIEAQDAIVKVIDLGSTNGTFINGRKLRPSIATLLREGECLTIGKQQFTLQKRDF